MGFPVLIYNGKTITFPNKPKDIALDFGPPRSPHQTLTGVRETVTAPRVDSVLRMEWPIIDNVTLRLQLENAMQWLALGKLATFALDSARAVDTKITVPALAGDALFWVNNPFGITAGRTYRIISGPNAQKVVVGSVQADKVTLSGHTLDFAVGPGALFRDEFFMPIALPDNVSPGSFVRILAPEEGQLTGSWPLNRFIFAPEFHEDLSQEGVMFIKNLAANETGSNVATAQPWFPTLGGITVASDTTYLFEGYLRISRSAGTTSHTTSILFGGSAVLASIAGKAQCNTGDTVAAVTENGVSFEVATATIVKPTASLLGTEQIAIKVSGTVRVTTTGTFIPQFQYSAAPGGAPSILRNSYFMLTSLGSASFASQGTWA